MIDIVPNAGENVADWVAERVNATTFGSSVNFGFYKKGNLVGGVVFSEYRIEDIVFSGAFEDKGCFTKRSLKIFFDYPFNQLKCHRVTAYTETDNNEANKLLIKLGFTNEGTMREISEKGKDANIYGMLKRECTWLGEENG
ncbi:MAG: GNAT family N-acetyltransferase [Candidatus Thioglobus sp.]|nr:GNAT family N-acetyltransferase [Candidatus Thioglobus sp.]